MNIRAYKLAEELGIDKEELVEKAKVLGIELRSAMAAVEPDQAERLRAKLGVASGRRSVQESRVERKGTSTVIRRRRTVTAEPEPEVVAIAEAEESSEDAAATAETLAAASLSEAEAAPAEEAPPGPESEDASAKRAAGPPDPTPTPREGATAKETSGGATDRKGRQRKRVREVVNLKEQEQFARQVTGRRSTQRRPLGAPPLSAQNPRSRRRDPAAKKALAVAPAAPQTQIVRIEGEITVGELAKQLGMKAAGIQGKLMALGTMISVNQALPPEILEQFSIEIGFEVQDVGFKEEVFLEPAVSDSAEEGGESATRPPIITVMGHVDHGKTSVLDAIRKTKVVDSEAGGITQHIGAYQVDVGGSKLTFIDTPGHAAFTQMRARGVQVTDLVVLVIAATEGVMPQTVEAIQHAQAADAPIVVAVNKCDLPGADPLRSRQGLMEHGLVPEEFGGDIVCVDISAKTGQGLDQLLEMIHLQAELLELKGTSSRRAKGVVIEAELDKGRGPMATVLVQDGTLKRGDIVIAGQFYGRVRQLDDDLGQRIESAGPSTPVRVLGLAGVPSASDSFHAVESERVAKQIVGHREERERARPVTPEAPLSLEDFFARAEGGGPKSLPIVLKADVQGTCEAVRDALEKLSTDQVKLKLLSSGVGGINENDIMLAKASGAIVVGFHVRPDASSRRSAESQGVDVRVYRVIMELLDEVRDAMAGLLPPTIKEKVVGQAEVREIFSIPKVGNAAGSYVTEGMLRRNAQCRLIRDGVEIYDGRIGSLRRFKDDVRDVQTGFECGVGIDGYKDVKVGDVIEVYELEEHPATL